MIQTFRTAPRTGRAAPAFRQHRLCGLRQWPSVLSLLLGVALAGPVGAVAKADHHGTPPPVTAAELQLSAQASLRARDACQAEMHEDAEPFVNCMERLLAQTRPRTRSQRFEALGLGYFAWLASAVASKNAMPHADEASERYVLRFRPWQKSLGVSDEQLCQTIEGDCVTRNARMRVVEQEALLHHRATPDRSHTTASSRTGH